jgi:hypothetical protein
MDIVLKRLELLAITPEMKNVCFDLHIIRDQLQDTIDKLILVDRLNPSRSPDR